MPRLRVAYLINQYPGISHTFVRREIQALERRGVDVARFAVRRSKQEIIAAEDKAEAEKTRHIVTAGPGVLAGAIVQSFAASPGRSLSSFVRALRIGAKSEAGFVRHFIYWAEAMALAHWLRQDRLDHVHAHFGTNSATVAMLAAEISGGGYSLTVHGPEEFDKPGLIALPEKIERARFVAGVSSFGMSQLRRLVGPQYWDRIKIVRCGVEAAFYAGESKPAAAGPRFVCVGRLCEQKGQITLVEAASLLKARGKSGEFVLVGDGEMRGAIERAARERGVADMIVFAGWKTPAEVRAEIEASRAFVLPSYAEGLPVSIMEAFCLERPVISTYIAGIPELVRPGENGWLAPAGDADALADALEAAIDASSESLAAMGRAGKAAVTARHDIDAIAGELEALFAETAATSSESA